MTTLAQVHLTMQAIQNLEGLRRDMRSNANVYITIADAIDGGTADMTLANLVALIQADANEYQKRLQLILAVYNDTTRQSDLVAGLQALGVALADAKSDYQELLTYANAQSNVTINTTSDVRTAANHLVNNLPAHDFLW